MELMDGRVCIITGGGGSIGLANTTALRAKAPKSCWWITTRIN